MTINEAYDKNKAEDWLQFHKPENNELLGKKYRLGGGHIYRVTITGPSLDDNIVLVQSLHNGETGRYALPARIVWRLIYEGLLEEI